MDTTRITAPITERIPTSGASNLVSTLADATAGLAGQIGHQAGQLGEHVGDIDVSDTVRRGRRFVGKVVPWVAPPPTRSRRWVLIVLGVVTVVGVLVVMRRRSSDTDTATRDDWSTSTSTNGVSPGSTGSTAAREPAVTNA